MAARVATQERTPGRTLWGLWDPFGLFSELFWLSGLPKGLGDLCAWPAGGCTKLLSSRGRSWNRVHEPLPALTFCKKGLVQRGFANQVRERKLNPNFFFLNFSGTPGISRQNPGISHQKSLISLVSRGIPNCLAPHPFVWKTPTPPEDIRAQKFRFGFVFRA